MEEVQKHAAYARWEHWTHAVEALTVLSEEAESMPLYEAHLRVFCHDAVHPHHDRDFRALAALPISSLDDVDLHVWCLDKSLHVREITIAGPCSGNHPRVQARV